MPYICSIKKQKTHKMKSQATHPNFKNWGTVRITLDTPVKMTEKAVMVTDDLLKGAEWFPLSIVNVIEQFEVEIPKWLLKKKGHHVMI